MFSLVATSGGNEDVILFEVEETSWRISSVVVFLIDCLILKMIKGIDTHYTSMETGTTYSS